jgi:hypothetical protein
MERSSTDIRRSTNCWDTSAGSVPRWKQHQQQQQQQQQLYHQLPARTRKKNNMIDEEAELIVLEYQCDAIQHMALVERPDTPCYTTGDNMLCCW